MIALPNIDDRAALNNPPPAAAAHWVQIVCPICFNASRRDRRRCRRIRSMCKGTGYAWKTL